MYKPLDHTFVVCAYKENPFLSETVQSLINQSIRSNIIISTSTPNDHIQRIAREFDIPIVVNPSPHLAGDDWNYGYDRAQTPLVTMAHQDDYYNRDYLSKILEALNEFSDDNSMLAFTDYYELRSGRRVDINPLLVIKRMMNAPLAFGKINASPFLKKRILSFGESICCPSVTYVKERLGNTIFDTTYKNSCDYQTFVNLAFEQGRFIYIPQPLMGHRIYPESATSANLAENIRKKEDAEILARLWPRPVARVINSFYALSEKSNKL